MPSILYRAMPTEHTRAYQAGAPDANGQAPERHVSDGTGNPCRHCLTEIAKGASMLILAYRPFPGPQPYAEIGPIFLHAEPCERHPEVAAAPAMFIGWERLLLKGYNANDRIVYGAGAVVGTNEMDGYAAQLLARDDIAYVHARSARNNCYQVRIDRA
jgi:hypothetical protein